MGILHGKSLLRADGEAIRLKATAPPLGLSPDKRVRSSRSPWVTGTDLLVLCSDGITESAGPGGERYGEDRLLETIRKAQGRGQGAQGLVDAVFADVEAFAPGASADDRTLLIVQG